MLTSNATLIERLLAPLRDAIAKTPKVPTNDVERLLAFGVPNVFDRRSEPRDEMHKRGRSHGTRPVSQVVALGVHQSAVGSLHQGHPRILAIPGHALVHKDGTITLLHDFQSVVWHGHAMNKFSIGIEVIAREPGVVSRPSTFWLSIKERAEGREMIDLASPATEEQFFAGVALGCWYADELARRGGKLRSVWAHRQAHSSRRSDPGERIYRFMCLPLIAKLGLDDVSGERVGSGRPVPKEWGAKTTERYA